MSYEKYKKFILEGGCPVNVCDDITISVPVIVRANADIEDVKLKCKGHTIEKKHHESHSESCSKEKFIIKQKIHVEIPIKFEAECDVGEGCADFDLHECECE